MAISQTYCAPMTKVEDRLVIVGTVPTGKTYTAGMVVTASALDTTIDGVRNYSVYAFGAPVDVKTTPLAIIINGGFEQLPDGRRPEGQPDFTQYTYGEGEVVTAIFLDDHLRFQITQDALAADQSPTVGQYLSAVNATNTLTAGAAKASQDCFLVEATKYLRTGGQFGSQFAQGYVVSASTHNVIA